MSDLLITHAMIMTVDLADTILDDGALFIAGGRIADLGPTAEVSARHAGAEVLDASGMVAMPGLINTHIHLSMTMLRSIADDIEASSWLPVIWALEAHLKPETVYAGAALGMAEMIASGTTCFNDHYFMMDEVARATAETGLRAQLAEAILENRNRRKGERDLENGTRFAAEWMGKADGRIVTRMGPHALYTCSTPLIIKAREAANSIGVGMHMHVAESKFEMRLVAKKDKAGETSVQHLDGLGVLGPDFVLAHGLTIDEKDIAILKRLGTGIAHCPQAYAKIGGWPFPPVDQWIKVGLHVGLGTDGVASNNNLDLFDEMRTATLTRKLFAKDGVVLPARQVIRMATRMGAQVLGLEKEIGSLEAGKRADVILIDFRKPHLSPVHNLPGHLVYSACGADVDTVIVDGRVLLRGRRFLTLDINEVLTRAQAEFEALLGRASWHPTLEEPKAGLAAAMKLKLTQQSLRVMQVLTGNRAPDEDDVA